MSKKKKIILSHSHHSRRSVVNARKFPPIKPLSKVKAIKMFPKFHQKKKKYSNDRWKRPSSKFSHRSHSTEFPPTSCSFNNSSWFWRNYEIAQQWQRAHTISVEKANMAVSIFQRSLLNPFQQSLPKTAFLHKRNRQFSSRETLDCPTDFNFRGSLSSLATDFTDKNEEDEMDGTCGNEEDYEFEFKVDENMRSFLEQSMRHKQEMQRLREAENEASLDVDLFEAPKESVMEERRKTMDFLYGDAAPKILSMEMALQMSFDRHFDQKQPAFWPNLPLTL